MSYKIIVEFKNYKFESFQLNGTQFDHIPVHPAFYVKHAAKYQLGQAVK